MRKIDKDDINDRIWEAVTGEDAQLCIQHWTKYKLALSTLKQAFPKWVKWQRCWYTRQDVVVILHSLDIITDQELVLEEEGQIVPMVSAILQNSWGCNRFQERLSHDKVLEYRFG